MTGKLIRDLVSAPYLGASTCFSFFCFFFSGCSAGWYQRSADEEVYDILKHERKAVTGEETPFRVEQAPRPLESVGKLGEVEDLKSTPAPTPVLTPLMPESPDSKAAPGKVEGTDGPKSEASSPTNPPEGGKEGEAKGDGKSQAAKQGGAEASAGASAPPGPSDASVQAARVSSRFLSLKEALELAFANNRIYQNNKEEVYISALTLTLAEHQFAPRFLGMIIGSFTRAGHEKSGEVSPNLEGNLLLANGARLAIDVLGNFSQIFDGKRMQVASTLFSGTLVQPLLRGFGAEVVREPLTQAEREVTYQVRAFERFRRTFAVSVITQYYQVLQDRDRVKNEYNNWQGLVTNRDRVEALANAGRVPRLQVDQARQQELEAQDRWIAAVERYESSLDGFKITLGIPTDSSVSLDQSELEKLGREEVKPPEVTADAAATWALLMRLDLKTDRERVKDAERKIRVAANGLRTQLDLNANAELTSGSDDHQKPLAFHSGRNLTYGFGFDLNLPLDRKAERNEYVEALIARERAQRALSLSEDNIRLTVRDDHRRLEREIMSYRIQRLSVDLAQQRVDSTSALLQATRAQTRDVLESQAALITARNALTAALISYAIARLEFLSDTEALHVDDSGQVRELPIGDTSK